MVRKTVQSRFDSGFLASVDQVVTGIQKSKSSGVRLTPTLNRFYAKDAHLQNDYEEGTRHKLPGMKSKTLELPPVGAFKLPSPVQVPQNTVEDVEVDQEIADLKTYEQPPQASIEKKPVPLLPKAAPPAKTWEAGGKRKSKFSQFLEENPVKETVLIAEEHKPSGKLAAFLNKNMDFEDAEREDMEADDFKTSTVRNVEMKDDVESEDEKDEDDVMSVASEVREPIRRVPEINRARSVKAAPIRKAVVKKAPSLDQEGFVLMIQNWFNSIVLFLLTVFNFLKDLILGKNELRVNKERTRSRGRPQSGRRSDKVLRLR